MTIPAALAARHARPSARLTMTLYVAAPALRVLPV